MDETRFFDGDDTLWWMDRYFKEYIGYGFALIEERGVVDNIQAFTTSFYKINKWLFHNYGAAPDRWGLLLNELSKSYTGLVSCRVELLDIYNQIYYVKPELKEGAIEVLDGSLSQGYKIVLSTFRNEEWGWRTLQQLGFYRHYFDASNVYFFHEQLGKTPATWADCFHATNATTGCVQVIGDSVPGDIIPPYDLGVNPRDLYYLHAPTWDANAGSPPSGVHTITTLTEILDLDTSFLYG